MKRTTATLAVLLQSTAAFADEGGASVWLPGQFASFAAVPGDPGFSLETIFYVRSASATSGVAFSRGATYPWAYAARLATLVRARQHPLKTHRD